MTAMTADSAASTSSSAAAVATPSTTSAPIVSFVPVYFPFSRYRTLTFSAGFLCGQASLIFVAVIFLRYVVFEDPKIAMREAGKRKKKRLRSATSKRQRRTSSSSRKALFSAAATIPQSDASILEKLNYDLSTHTSESTDWINVLVAQAVVAYRSMIVASGGREGRGAKGYVEDALNQARGDRETDEAIVTLDYINVTEFDFGQEYPIFSSARVRPSNESGKVRIEIDLDYTDHLSLGIETKVLINFPKPKFAILPVSLALALVRLSATLIVEIPPPNFTSSSTVPSSSPSATMSLSLYPDFILELASTSLIGSRAKLQDIPKVEQLIVGRIRAWVNNNLVWPKVKTVKLPSIGGNASSSSTADDVSKKQQASEEEDTFAEQRSASSPDMGSAVDDEDEEEDEEAEESEVVNIRAHISPQKQHTGSNVKVNPKTPENIKIEAFTSSFENDPPPSHALLRDRRRSSMASSSAEASTTSAPPELSDSQSSEQFRDIYKEAMLRHRAPLNSPGLGIGYASSANISRNPSSNALYRSTASSVQGASSRYNQGQQSQKDRQGLRSADSSGFFDVEDPRWAKAKKAARDRQSFSPLHDQLVSDEL